MLEETNSAFWAGYQAALDDCERAWMNWKLKPTWFARVREKFGLPAFKSNPSDSMRATHFADRTLWDETIRVWKEAGAPEEKAVEVAQFASRVGKEIGCNPKR
jgi:hypothetical protein